MSSSQGFAEGLTATANPHSENFQWIKDESEKGKGNRIVDGKGKLRKAGYGRQRERGTERLDKCGKK